VIAMIAKIAGIHQLSFNHQSLAMLAILAIFS
jgi:hypothetical protein